MSVCMREPQSIVAGCELNTAFGSKSKGRESEAPLQATQPLPNKCKTYEKVRIKDLVPNRAHVSTVRLLEALTGLMSGLGYFCFWKEICHLDLLPRQTDRSRRSISIRYKIGVKIGRSVLNNVLPVMDRL